MRRWGFGYLRRAGQADKVRAARDGIVLPSYASATGGIGQQGKLAKEKSEKHGLHGSERFESGQSQAHAHQDETLDARDRRILDHISGATVIEEVCKDIMNQVGKALEVSIQRAAQRYHKHKAHFSQDGPSYAAAYRMVAACARLEAIAIQKEEDPSEFAYRMIAITYDKRSTDLLRNGNANAVAANHEHRSSTTGPCQKAAVNPDVTSQVLDAQAVAIAEADEDRVLVLKARDSARAERDRVIMGVVPHSRLELPWTDENANSRRVAEGNIRQALAEQARAYAIEQRDSAVLEIITSDVAVEEMCGRYRESPGFEAALRAVMKLVIDEPAPPDPLYTADITGYATAYIRVAIAAHKLIPASMRTDGSTRESPFYLVRVVYENLSEECHLKTTGKSTRNHPYFG